MTITEGDEVTVGGIVSYEHPGNDWVEVRFAEGADGTAIVPREAIILRDPPPDPGKPVCPKCGTSGCLEDKALDF